MTKILNRENLPTPFVNNNYIPRIGVWELTLACNSNCLHCGSYAGKKREDELTTEEAFHLVDDLAELKCERIILSGGEPTLRKDWYDIANRLKEKDIEVGIITTALRTEGLIDKLKQIEPFSVGVSIDGKRATHDYLRGVKGSYDKIFSFIRELRKNELVSCAVTSVNHKNISELEDVRDALYVYQVNAWQIQISSPMGRMAEHKELLITPEDYVYLANFVAESRYLIPEMNIQPGDCIGYFGSLETYLRDSNWQGCQAGMNVIGIEANGNIKECLSLQIDGYVEGNIRERPLKEIWNDKNNFQYNRNFDISSLPGLCSNCEYGSQCRGGCSSNRFSYENNSLSPYCLHRFEKNGQIIPIEEKLLEVV